MKEFEYEVSDVEKAMTVNPFIVSRQNAGETWFNPLETLPDTEDGEEYRGSVSRVWVDVITSDGQTHYHIQFRRRTEERGGGFCGFAGTDVPGDGDYMEWWEEWVVYGSSSYHPQNTVRMVTSWKFSA